MSCYHSPTFHTLSHLHFTLPHIVSLSNTILPSTHWSTKYSLSHTKFCIHFPSPNHPTRHVVCIMKLLSCNTICMHSTHYTHLSSCCPFECCSSWPHHLVLPTFPHSQMTPHQKWLPPLLRKKVQAMWWSHSTTNRLSSESGQNLLLALANHYQIQCMCVALYLTETVIQ
jgi:hypothetical protein